MQCPICLQKFNTTDRQPYDACTNRHCYCKKCIRELLNSSQCPKCPECRQTISRKEVILNRAAHGILQEIATNDHTALVIEPPKSGHEDSEDKASPVEGDSFEIRLFGVKVLLLCLLGWTTPIVSWLYLFNLGGWYQLALLYFVLYRFYQILRNWEQMENGKLRLLLKISLFGMMDEIDKSDRLFYAQFSFRWIGSVVGISLIHGHFGYAWTPLAIAALALNVFSVLEIIVGRFYLKQMLDYAMQPEYEWLPSVTLVATLLVGLVSSIANLASIGMGWYPSLIIYFICWLATLTYYLAAKHSKACCADCGTTFLLMLAYPYSIGMFVWMKVKHYTSRIPAYGMLVLRYLLCPAASVALLVLLPPGLERFPASLLMAGQMLATMELGLGVYLISR